jgi:hypothetical protein
MFVCSPRIKRYFLFLSGLGLCFFLNLSCNLTIATDNKSQKFYKYKLTEIEFDPGDREKFEFSDLSAQTDRNGRLLVKFKKKSHSNQNDLGTFFRISEDGGKTFGKEIDLAGVSETEKKMSWDFYFVQNGLVGLSSQENNLFFSRSDKTFENWSDQVQINDEQNSIVGGFQLIQRSEKEIYLVWIDKRRGFNLIFFSFSMDGGKTWSANQPIDYDFREGNQQFPQFIEGQNGRLLVFWEDWRDRKTLVDIRYSFSDDGGISWSQSQKVNDDEKAVWQMFPKVAADGKNIYVVFSDFREKGEYDDNDWNIYFAHSNDNGTTWQKNKRLNDLKVGLDGTPRLTLDPEGNLYCLWESTRENLFGQIVFSYSQDQGKNWAPSIPLTSKDKMSIGLLTNIEYQSPDKFLIRLAEEGYGFQRFQNYFLEKTDELIDSNLIIQNKKSDKNFNPLKYEEGKTLFEDDFSEKVAEKWTPETGIWDIVGGTYMGVYPNSNKSFVSFANLEEPESYVLSGRFRLDEVSHTAASIYFRTSEDKLKHYVISNQFRIGTWLSLKDNDLPNGLHIAGGEILAQKLYPFRQNRWYEFSLIVTPRQIDYYVDGRLMLSKKVKISRPKGKIGIGGFISSPTYFDDISVREIRK